MGDVGERAAVDEGRVVLERLHQVRHQRVLQQDGHRPWALELLGGDQLALARLADHHAAEAPLEIAQIAGEAEHRHDLGGDRDVEAILTRKAVRHAAQAVDDRAQRTVIHVDHAAPGDAAGVEIELVTPIDVVVDHRREQVVRGADGVEIAGEVKIDVLHRHHLGVPAPGGAALHPEARPERGLPGAAHRPLADPVQGVAEPNGGGRLAFARGGRGDRRDQDQAPVGPIRDLLDEIEADLRDVLAVGLDRCVRDLELGRNLGDRQHGRRARDLDVGLGHWRPLCPDLTRPAAYRRSPRQRARTRRHPSSCRPAAARA